MCLCVQREQTQVTLQVGCVHHPQPPSPLEEGTCHSLANCQYSWPAYHHCTNYMFIQAQLKPCSNSLTTTWQVPLQSLTTFLAFLHQPRENSTMRPAIAMGNQDVHIPTRRFATTVGATCNYLQSRINLMGELFNLQEVGGDING